MPRKEKIDNIDLPEQTMASSAMMTGLGMAKYYAIKVRYWIVTVPHIPDWETMAEDEIKNALTELKDVERRLNEALALYHAKPKGD